MSCVFIHRVGFVCYSSYEKRYFYCNSLFFFVCFVMIPLRVVLLAVLQKNIFFILMTTGILFSFKYFAYHFYSYINIILYMSVLRGVSVWGLTKGVGFGKKWFGAKQTVCIESHILYETVFVAQTTLKQRRTLTDWLTGYEMLKLFVLNAMIFRK